MLTIAVPVGDKRFSTTVTLLVVYADEPNIPEVPVASSGRSITSVSIADRAPFVPPVATVQRCISTRGSFGMPDDKVSFNEALSRR